MLMPNDMQLQVCLPWSSTVQVWTPTTGVTAMVGSEIGMQQFKRELLCPSACLGGGHDEAARPPLRPPEAQQWAPRPRRLHKHLVAALLQDLQARTPDTWMQPGGLNISLLQLCCSTCRLSVQLSMACACCQLMDVLQEKGERWRATAKMCIQTG